MDMHLIFLILTGVGIILWHLFGSPDLTSTLISIVIFFAGSGVLLWKKIFQIENNLMLEIEKLKMGKGYMWYTTCPKCAKKYGKNYVVILSEVT